MRDYRIYSGTSDQGAHLKIFRSPFEKIGLDRSPFEKIGSDRDRIGN
jgi:hypothetical protein